MLGSGWAYAIARFRSGQLRSKRPRGRCCFLLRLSSAFPVWCIDGTGESGLQVSKLSGFRASRFQVFYGLGSIRVSGLQACRVGGLRIYVGAFRFGLSARRTLRLQGFRVWRFSHEALPVQSPGAITSLGCRVWASNGWHVFGFLLACGLNGLIAALRLLGSSFVCLGMLFMFLPTIRAEFRVYGIAQFETRPYTGNTRSSWTPLRDYSLLSTRSLSQHKLCWVLKLRERLRNGYPWGVETYQPQQQLPDTSE